jgi:hypothetical protein
MILRLRPERWRILDAAMRGTIRYLCQRYRCKPGDREVRRHPLYLAMRELWLCALAMRVSAYVDAWDRERQIQRLWPEGPASYEATNDPRD